ncbi:MAG: hypothetical protein KKA19_04290, partial [Candidatus Margulisbacteria bacterium]|nr:hypothetical protein [Candidatus Margulisiibacteriota bacterium]
MKIKIYISFIMTVIALIIISGCGDGGDVAPTSSLTQPDTSTNIATLVIKVKWPDKLNSGSYTISSKNSSEELTTSTIPVDTKRIDIKVLQYSNTSNILGSAS